MQMLSTFNHPVAIYIAYGAIYIADDHELQQTSHELQQRSYLHGHRPRAQFLSLRRYTNSLLAFCAAAPYSPAAIASPSLLNTTFLELVAPFMYPYRIYCKFTTFS
jgi:hypothetical protein